MVAVTSLEGAVPAQRARVGPTRCVPTRTQRGGDFRVWPDCVHATSLRQMKPGDIIGVSRAARGNTGALWLEAKILRAAPGGFYDWEVEYTWPPPRNTYRRVSSAHCVPWASVSTGATEALLGNTTNSQHA